MGLACCPGQHASASVVPVKDLLDYECHIADMVETRAAPRYRVMKQAKLEFGGYKRECVIRDLSTTGAALEVMDQTSIPKHFNLVVPATIRNYLAPSFGAEASGSA